MNQQIAMNRLDNVLIEAKQLSKIYASKDGEDIIALQSIDFSIPDGAFVSVVGRRGCGKSTLIKIFAGLITCTSGSIEIEGKPIQGPGPDVGVVFQAPVLLPWRTIIDNVLLPSQIRNTITPAVRDHARALLATVGLDGFEARYPYELSGGMQQRAAIVRALVHNPRLLLMDEPFGALDAMTREQMNLEVLRIWKTSHKTIIFVTHSIAEAVFLSDHVFVMTPRPGRLSQIIDIDLPRPRTLEMINSDGFGVFTNRIRKLLDAEGDITA